MFNAFKRPTATGCFASVLQAASLQRFSVSDSGACASLATDMARRTILALACIAAADAGSALAEGTAPLTAANFDDFVEGALAAGKTAMVRFIASEG